MDATIYILGMGCTICGFALVGVCASYSMAKREYKDRIKLDISVEDMKKAEKDLDDFLVKNNLPTNASVQEIADVLKIRVGGEDKNIKGKARLEEPDEEGTMFVTFKKGLTIAERHWQFAHELGHKVNGDPVPATYLEGYNKPRIEQLADYTGAAMLMPLEQVSKFLLDAGYERQSARKRVSIVKELCKKYGVSDVIALRRIQEVQKLSS